MMFRILKPSSAHLPSNFDAALYATATLKGVSPHPDVRSTDLSANRPQNQK